ncbi:hypothetical protein [Photobacterium rosenbergii]|uniref:hypothetical protein n=1 Tax=Photobacterium rosenbergii TaxID=294936 RepID=UPI0013048DDF|nr:hypothetical protein [Photobacterium rosenbergii]
MVAVEGMMAFLQKNGLSIAIIANKLEVEVGEEGLTVCISSVKKMRAGVILRAKSKSLA